MICSIYTLKNPITSKVFYIGSTIGDLNIRLSCHLSSSGVVSGYCKENEIIPVVELLKRVSVDSRSSLMLIEKHFIKKFITSGGELINRQFHPNNKKNTSLSSLKISDEAQRELKIFAAEKVYNMSVIASDAILQYIKSQKGKPKEINY